MTRHPRPLPIDTPLSRFRLSTGIEMDALDIGPRDAPVLLFLHGFPENHRTWRHQIAYFADRYRCIAPDQRGYRGTSKPQDVGAYTPDKIVADTFALADAAGVQDFTLIGHDWGGAMAWNIALVGQKNGRIPRLVIANAPHPWIFQRLLITDPQQRAASQYIRAFRDPANDALVREHGLGGLLAKAIKWGRSDRLEPQERDLLYQDWQDRDSAFGMLNWYRATGLVVPEMDENAPMPEFAAAPFPILATPTLVIWATDDQALPASNLEGLDEVVSDLTIVRVPDCGHFVPWEAPDAVNAAMEDWLAAH